MKKILIVIMAIVLLLSLTSCNVSMVDTTWSFERAIIRLPDGSVVEGKVHSWLDYDNTDTIQVKIDDKVYFTHVANVCLISEGK